VLKGTLRLDAGDQPATTQNVLAALGGNDFFWLDLDDEAADGEVAELLSVHFKFHPLAVQSAERFNQRPRIDDYEGFMYLVARGADPEKTGHAEVHCFWTDRYVVTVHRGDCPALAQVRERIERHHAKDAASPQIVMVYFIVSALVDSFFPVLSKFDDRIDDLEDDILKAPTEAQLGELFDMKRRLMDMRKVIAPQRDMMASINSGVADVPGMTDEASRYFRDLYDHLIRLADLVDNYRDLLSSVMDTHLSTVSNRLNVVMKQLTIIATIFLPLSFLTGFFGQNFAFLVRSIAGTWSFWVLAVGLDVAAVVALVWIFRRRGWLGGPTV
jgi:magnesium transporter